MVLLACLPPNNLLMMLLLFAVAESSARDYLYDGCEYLPYLCVHSMFVMHAARSLNFRQLLCSGNLVDAGSG